MSPRARWNLLLIVPTVLALWMAGEVFGTWAGRLAYPYDLEWMEGGVLAHAWRVQHFQPLYQTPDPDFIPMIYTPGYYYVLAVLGWVVGLSHALGRFVSILGTLAACGAIVFLAHRHFDKALIGVVGAAVYLGMYEESGAFMDLVRPDATAVGLLAWGIALGSLDRPKHWFWAGLLVFFAFVVKHNTAAWGVPISLGIWAWRGYKPALLFGLSAAIPGALYTGIMQLGTWGHFLGYVVDVPRSHPMVVARALPGAVRETGGFVPIAVACLALWVISLGPRVAPRIPVPAFVIPGVLGAGLAGLWMSPMPSVKGISDTTLFEAWAGYALFGVLVVVVPLALLGMALQRRAHGPWIYGMGIFVTAACVAALMRGHHGGFLNVFMPYHWALAAAFTMLLAHTTHALPGARGVAIAATLGVAQLAWQLDHAAFDRLVPDADDVAAGDAVVAELAQHDGPVLSSFAPWMAAQAGHAPGWHLIALWDIRHPDGPYRSDVETITKAIRNGYYGAVVDASETMGFGVLEAYREVRAFDFSGRTLMPRTGWRRRPSILRVPKGEAAPARDAAPPPRRRGGKRKGDKDAKADTP